MKRDWRFYAGFAVVALICAGVLSYFASSDPDGLDSATLKGCETVRTDQGEKLVGDCIAQHAKDHAMSDSPFADYTVNGDSRFTGVAGVLGVLVTAVLAGGLFWFLRRPSRRPRRPEGPRRDAERPEGPLQGIAEPGNRP